MRSKHKMAPTPMIPNQTRQPASTGSGGTVDTSARPKRKGTVSSGNPSQTACPGKPVNNY